MRGIGDHPEFLSHVWTKNESLALVLGRSNRHAYLERNATQFNPPFWRCASNEDHLPVRQRVPLEEGPEGRSGY